MPQKSQYESVLSFDVEIFDLSGRKVHSIQSKNENKMIWDLKNSTGQKVAAGTYFYQAKIKTANNEVLKSNKLIVVD